MRAKYFSNSNDKKENIPIRKRKSFQLETEKYSNKKKGKFYGLVLGLVELIDAKGIDVAQL